MKKLKWNRSLTILVLFMFITVTFASFNTNLFVDGKAYVRANKQVRITNVELIEATNDAYDSYEPEYTQDTITINSNLPNQNSTATYRITIQNQSSDDYDVQDIIEEKYSNSKISYNITGLTVDNTILEANTTSTFLLTLSNNTTITSEPDVYETETFEFDYTGGEQEFTVPYTGDYTLEVWGAQGASSTTTYNSNVYTGGYGGYSKGTIHLKQNERIYINVGGTGETKRGGTVVCKGGYNGGGDSASYYEAISSCGGGGGATHIAKIKGELKTLEQFKGTLINDEYYDSNVVYIVAGGGGAGAFTNSVNNGFGGHAGGYIGATAICEGRDSLGNGYGTGGTQTAGGYRYSDKNGLYRQGTFGQGFSDSTSTLGRTNPSGGGGGFFGGGGTYVNASGGGSGYIASTLLTNKEMYCYGCEESNEVNTKTVSTENHSSSPISQYAKEGNGYAKITITRKIEDGSEYAFDYTGDQQTLTVPYTGTYQLETWGAQGGDLQKFKAGYYGGYGGYSRGKIDLVKGQTLYIVVGGAGRTNSTEELVVQGGYNGGGSTYGNFISDSGARYAGAGGGATHIATIGGVLSSLESNQDKVIMVSGGGAGSWYYGSSFRTITPGSGGGYIGGEGTSYSNYNSANTYHTSSGGTQTGPGESGTKFGSFGSGTVFTTKTENGGSGGGWYGGNSSHYGAAGGSGYIGYNNLYDKIMYCYSCEESEEDETKTKSTLSHSLTPKKNISKEGNGYAKIKLLKRESNSIELSLKFDIQKLTDYVINYDLDGGTLSNPIETYTRNSENFTLPTPTKVGYDFVGWIGGKNLFNPQAYYETGKTFGVEIDNLDIYQSQIAYQENYTKTPFKAKSNTQYTLSFNWEATFIKENAPYMNSGLSLYNEDNVRIGDSSDRYIEATAVGESGYKEITSTPEENAMQVGSSGWQYYGTFKFTNVQVEEGNKVTAYEPYISTPNNNISIIKGTRGNRTYTAVWTPKTYDITYDLDGGTLSNPVNTYNLDTETFTLPSPTKEGYEFLGWTGGKNIFDYKTAKKVYAAGNTSMTKIDGGLRISSTAESNCRYWYTRIGSLADYANQYYTYSANMTASADNSTRSIVSKTSADYSKRTTMTTTYLNSNGNLTLQIHPPGGVYTEFVLGFYANACTTTTATSYYVDYTNIQLEYGKEFTGYEDYIREPSSITIPKGSMGYRNYIANWKDITSPTLSLDKETYIEGFDGWDLPSGHTVQDGVLSMDATGTSTSPYIETNGQPWRLEFDAYATNVPSMYQETNQGGYYSKSYYFDDNYEPTEALNGNTGNGRSDGLILNEWNNGFEWVYPNSYGNNIKYTKVGFTVGTSAGWANIGGKIRNLKFYSSGTPNDFYDILITTSDNVGVTTTKYAAGSHNASYFESNGTDVTDNKVRVTSNGTYTVYVADAEGNATVQEIEITNIVNAD